ncbi:MAG TPA: polyribonucleotide nucleotidyltransferase [Parachlamydiales bacterium]|nr:polyribonucleotide nucleotidyltransferase [Parachlamydiales bacterium]
MFKTHSKSVEINGRDLKFETGKIARQAHGAVTLQAGETVLLATACRAEKADEGIDFFPLRVDYQEKFSSTGKTLGGFIKREGRPTEREILLSRLIDRPLRPLFPEGYYKEVQILAYVLSYDGIHAPDPLAICAASAALTLSDIPLLKPIAAVRVGQIDGRFVVNPTIAEMEKSRLDLILAGTEEAIMMIEGYADFLTEEEILEAVQEGHGAIRQICRVLKEWREEIGKPKESLKLILPPAGLVSEIDKTYSKEVYERLQTPEKKKREEVLHAFADSILETYIPGGVETSYKKRDVKGAIKTLEARLLREMALKENRRIDGRTCDEVRPIQIETELLPRTHGSALFTRGETQSISVCTLGGEAMAQRYETIEIEGSRRFYLQYFFPPFSVGEVGRMGAPGRREIGHGKLAERSLALTIPSKEQFPYTIRLESNITESNGSSSMASVCGGTLALMEAGVPIKHPIAGIAMGLILEGENFAVLSDILGAEDALGDMDFKVAGNSFGITAFQLDIKIEGITAEIMKVALAQAKQGRLHILKKMMEACPRPKEHLSPYAPRIQTIQVKPSKIAIIIGPGGKQIRAITEETGAEIEIDDSGFVSIVSNNAESLEKAKKIIHDLTAEVEVGKTYVGKVTSIVDFGVFVAIFSKEGLCHISQLSHERLNDVRDIRKICKEGDEMEVKVLEINDRGQIRLSRKALLPSEHEPQHSRRS